MQGTASCRADEGIYKEICSKWRDRRVREQDRDGYTISSGMQYSSALDLQSILQLGVLSAICHSGEVVEAGM